MQAVKEGASSSKLKVFMRGVKNYDLLTKLRVGEEAHVRKSAAYKAVVDNFSMDILATSLFSFTELLSHMSLKEVLQSRAIYCVIGIPLNPIYGWYKDKLAKIAGITKYSSGFKKTLIDTIAVESFWLPVYGSWLYVVNDKDMHKTLPAVATGAVISLFYGRPLGIWMDQVRMWSGIRSDEK